MREFSEKLKRGLEIAEKRMLKEKALRGQDVIVCDEDNNIRRIPAEEVIQRIQSFNNRFPTVSRWGQIICDSHKIS